MDRRLIKTRKAIFDAFKVLLKKKRYGHITVQEIIDLANVGRSTFYSHFETKDSLLETMCSEIFTHVFETTPCPYLGHDNDIKANITHTLWHIKESGKDISDILCSDSQEIFTGYLKKYLIAMFSEQLDSVDRDAPREFLLNHLSASLIEAVKWWATRDYKESPETISLYLTNCIL